MYEAIDAVGSSFCYFTSFNRSPFLFLQSVDVPGRVAATPHRVAATPYRVITITHRVIATPYRVASTLHRVKATPYRVVATEVQGG